MELNNVNSWVSLLILILLIHSIPVSVSVSTAPSQKNYAYVTSTTPPVLIPRLETWARAMQLSFRSISEPPIQSPSQFQSQSSGMVSMPYHNNKFTTNTLLLQSQSPPPPFLDGNSDVLERTMKSIAWLAKLGSIHAQRLCDSKYEGAKILTTCKDSYENASTNLQQAMKALLSKDVERMKSMLTAVLSNVAHCRDGYSVSGKPSPLAAYDDKVTKMTNNCLTVLDLVR